MIRIRVAQVIQRLRIAQRGPLFGPRVTGCRGLTISRPALITTTRPVVDVKTDTPPTSVKSSTSNEGEVFVDSIGVVRGQVINGKPEGWCVSEIKGKTYVGEFKSGILLNGSGIMKQDTGYYIGKVKDGLKIGVGVWKHNDFIYEGLFVDNLPHGKGMLTRADGTVFEGNFQEGKRNGEGKLTTPQGAVFQGPWVNDVEHGLGTVKLSGHTFDVAMYNGNIEVFTLRSDVSKVFSLLKSISYDEGLLQGTFIDGKAQGWCIFTTPAGTRHIGEYRAGTLISGSGRCSNGSEVYLGAIKEGQREGYGVWRNIETGQSYTGSFHRGLYHGQGRLTYSDGSVAEGTFRNGFLHGIATHTDAVSGITYQGAWENDRFHGEGTLTDAKGASFDAYFIHGMLMKGRGELSLPCGREVANLLKEIIHRTFVLPSTSLEAYSTSTHLFTKEDGPVKSVTARDPKRGISTTQTTFASGAIHYGPLLDGLPHGTGRTVFPTGEEYVGDYVHGARHGHGLELTASGKYEGTWKNNQKEGEGKMVYADGKIFAGYFLQNRPHGAGTVSYNKSLWKIAGEFQNGHILNGNGQFCYLDRVFFAEFVEGELERSGMYIKHDVFVKLKPGQVTAQREGGRVQGTRVTPSERWNNQRGSVKHVQGLEIRQDGTIYEGEWLRSMKHGVGMLFFANGSRHKGIWDSDTMVK
uniref:Uncharacterized protein n=1 Tax=Spumella elongata TaxID=89044 RepID=A0A7S3H3C1_9STRA|mmetsp:Transcript_3335/g.5562  ORF Transcript_3335/g.5562 Transcript_3335/m.5562 type:complete len:692 (+) Transcript_3335:3-2078(+)